MKEREYIAELVPSRFNPCAEGRRLETANISSVPAHVDAQLQQFLDRLCGAEPSSGVEAVEVHDEDEPRDGAQGVLEQQSLPSLQQLRNFMFRSAAIGRLHESCRNSLFPMVAKENESADGRDRGTLGSVGYHGVDNGTVQNDGTDSDSSCVGGSQSGKASHKQNDNHVSSTKEDKDSDKDGDCVSHSGRGSNTTSEGAGTSLDATRSCPRGIENRTAG